MATTRSINTFLNVKQVPAAFVQANTAFQSANNVAPQIEPAFLKANSAYASQNASGTYANSAFAHANAAFVSANNVAPQIEPAFLQANSAYAHANAAFTSSNTKLATSGGTVNGDLAITGNLIVSGSKVEISTANVLLQDNIITINSDLPTNIPPIDNAGLEVNRGSSANVAIIWDETTDSWTFTNDGTNYETLGGGSAGSYANSAFIKANAAYNAANSVNVYDANTSATSFFSLPKGTTAQRPASPQVGSIRFNTSNNYGELYTANGWVSFGQQSPTISSVTPATYNGESGTQFTINGTNFTSDAQVYFIDSSTVSYTAAVVTYSSSALILATTPQDFTVAQGPLDVQVVQQSGSVTKIDCITTGNTPSWVTASGTVVNTFSSVFTGGTGTLSATDADANATITYSLVSNPDFVSLNSSSGVIYSNATFNSYSPSTTYNFTGRATDNAGNSVDRSFNVVVRTPEFYSDGADGNLIVTSGSTFYTASNTSGGRTYADGIVQKTSAQLSSGATTIVLDATSVGLAANDLILITSIRGNTSNYTDVGKYEFAYVDSISTNTITLKTALVNNYVETNGIIVQRVPKYFNVYVDGTLTTNPYDGLTTSSIVNGKYISGIVAISCKNVLQVNASGSITATGLGYRGGNAIAQSGVNGRGESYGGDSFRTTAAPSTASFLGGGGAGNHQPGAFSGGGGGASYGTVGEAGYADNAPASGAAGSTYGINTLATMYLGSGGAGGSESGTPGTSGGGIVALLCRTLTNSGSITAAGLQGGSASGSSDGGGAGSGGSVYIRAGATTIGTCTALGGNRGPGNTGSGNSAGGYGGGGRVAVYYKTSISGSVPTGSAQQPTYYNTTYT